LHLLVLRGLILRRDDAALEIIGENEALMFNL